MATNRLLVSLGLVLVLFACCTSALLNPCCPGSPYNGEQTKMHMIWFLRDLGGYNRFLTALNDSSKHAPMPWKSCASMGCCIVQARPWVFPSSLNSSLRQQARMHFEPCFSSSTIRY